MRHLFVFGALLACCLPAQASEQMAGALGCYSCHGEPARRNVPSFKTLAQQYAAYRGQPDAVRKLVDRMHHGSLFSHVAAHERLTEEQAQALVRWLVEGTP